MLGQDDIFSLALDIGGTYVRAAQINAEGRPSEIRRYLTKDVPSIGTIIEKYVGEKRKKMRFGELFISAAAHIFHGEIYSEDVPFLQGQVREHISSVEHFGFTRVRFCNDIVAASVAIAGDRANLANLVEGAFDSDSTAAAVGVGTGFGAAVIISTKNCIIIHSGEVGFAQCPVIRTESPKLDAKLAGRRIRDVVSGKGVAWLASELGQRPKLILPNDPGEPNESVSQHRALEIVFRALAAVLAQLVATLLVQRIVIFGGVTERLLNSGLLTGETITTELASLQMSGFDHFVRACRIDYATDDLMPLLGVASMASVDPNKPCAKGGAKSIVVAR